MLLHENQCPIRTFFCFIISVKSGEFCDYDGFSASCKDGEVLQILKGTYGHMEVGKCIGADIGYLGCKADVTDMLNTVCNRKLTCSIELADQKFRDFDPCQSGIALYLQASYACLRGRQYNHMHQIIMLCIFYFPNSN